jgi:class 3 adenylate cyclase
MAGMADARCEAAALGKEGQGLFDIWDHCPEGTELMALDDTNRDDFVARLKEKKYPKTLVDHFSNLYRKIVLFPSNPAVIDDKPRWAWLEFDQTTFKTVAVIDTGENGALVQKYIGDIYAQSASFLVGALVGVDASLWAVAAYSLEMDDYKEILKAAKKFVNALGNNFGVGVKAGPVSAGVGVGGTPSVSVGRAVQFGLSPSEISKGNNILGFGNGYKAGVEYYFSKAQ